MFIFKFFIKSFKFPKLLKSTNEKMWKIIVYFLILVLVSTFPASYEAVKNEGSRLDFIIEDFNREIPINWDIPNNIIIKGGRLITDDDKTYVNKHLDITYIINNKEVIDAKKYTNHIIMSEKSILYIDGKGNYLESFDYKGFSEDQFDFLELELATGDEKVKLFQEFARSIEKSFATQIVLYTVLRNSATQIIINIVYVLLLAGLVQLFKFGYQNFLSYKESVKFVVLAMGLPATITFLMGIFVAAFAPVVFQLSMGMVVMLVILIYGKKTFV